MHTKEPMAPDPSSAERAFAQAAVARPSSLVVELWSFLAENKKWWLAPVVLVLLGIGLLVTLGGTAAAPFIYTLF